MSLILPSILATVFLSAVWMAYHWAIRLARPPKWLSRVSDLLLGVFIIGAAVSYLGGSYLPAIATWRPVMSVLLTGGAFLLYLGLGFLMIALINLIWRLTQRWSKPPPAPKGRYAAQRAFTDDEPSDRRQGASGDRRPGFNRIAVSVVAALSLVVTGYGVFEASRPRVDQIAVYSNDLPEVFDGIKVALVSDLHVGPTVSGSYAAKIVDLVMAQEPDLIVLAGDMVSGPLNQLSDELTVLRDLHAPYGVVYVIGNHEAGNDTSAWMEYFATLGIIVLDNDGFLISGPAGIKIDVIGINDPNGIPPHSENLMEALEKVARNYNIPIEGAGRFRILVAHEPLQALTNDSLPAKMGIDLQLSGHTHGGQFWPFGYLLLFQQPVVAGIHEVGGVQVVTTNGVGSSGPPVRVGAHPQIMLLELKHGTPVD